MSQAKIYGLIGYPVRHSLSPLMHNAAFSRLKIKAKYKLFELKERQVGPFLGSLAQKNIFGLNVTIPYKEMVMRFADGFVSESARATGAVNTLVVDKKGKLKAYNTDYLGFAKDLKEKKVLPRKAAVIGAGGASKAVVFALLKMKAEEIAIYDIDKFRSLALVKNFHHLFPECRFKVAGSAGDLEIKEKDLLVNASPVGMKNDDPCLVEPSVLHPGLFVYDVIYNPPETKLLSLARERGLKSANGLGMLLYQGVEAFNLWVYPKKAPVEVMREALEKGVKKLWSEIS